MRGIVGIVALALLAQPSAAKERVLLSTVRGFYNTALDELATRYMELNPDVQVDINLQPDNFSIKRYYIAGMAADRASAPDIVHGNLLGVNENYHQGRFLAVFDHAFLISLAVDGIHYCVLPLDNVDMGVYYNKDIFARLELVPPESFEEWIELCQVVEANGIIPISVPGSAINDFTVGISNLLEDASMRQLMPQIIAQPGDWNYVEANGAYVHDPNDLYADRFITINPERAAKAFLEGSISFEMPMFVEAYAAYQEIAQYFEFGFLGTDQAGAYDLFLTGRAAMWLIGSWRVGVLMKDLTEMPPEHQFDWAVFNVPSVARSQHGLAPLRGLGGAGHQLCVVDKKDPAQHDRVIDFLMFLYAPEQSAYLISRTLEVGEFIQGMPLIKGSADQLPADVADKLSGFGGRGYVRWDMIPNRFENETVARTRPWRQLFSLGRISTEEFMRRKQSLTVELIKRLVKRRGYDLDPTTEDVAPE